MPRSHFRLKVDLSKFFNDARRICWIFVDLTKFQHVIHVKQHSTKIFGIREPFHLLLNDAEYLPPMEDIRILIENETIKVIPGSGIQNEVLNAVVTVPDTNNNKNFSKTKAYNNISHNKVVETTDATTEKIEINTSNGLDVSEDPLNYTDSALIYNNTANAMFTTAIDDIEADADSKVMEYSNISESCNTIDSATKRKRVRKRKPRNNNPQETNLDNKHNSLEVSSSDTKEESKSKKPKIINSLTIPTGKHIRFSDTEQKENHVNKLEIANDSVEFHTSKLTSKGLSTLLALGQSSTPITFTKKIKDNSKTENFQTPIISAIEVDMESPTEEKAKCIKHLKKTKSDNSIEKSVCTIDISRKMYAHKDLLNLPLENFPVMTRKPRVGDIISFKTLKLADDYTPQISNFIIGETWFTTDVMTKKIGINACNGLDISDDPLNDTDSALIC
ncbi:hypothetical protein EAI_04990 [Harpegnathos saltator]|uniref:Uncharacterized protein n=1 Tax=Harpegnathos saltator TaxID=610380 RepID=E2C181_HARSA|nr:hypothetical protein EAI_04990 [Harpegnathos saltator]